MTDAWIRNAVAEAIGTFLLVTGVVLVADLGATPSALTYGFIVTGLMVCFGHVSGGHFNPAITLAMLLDRKIDILAAIAYWVAQFLGGIAGAAAVWATTDMVVVELGVPQVADGVSIGGAMALEAIFTFAVVLVFFGSIVDDRAPISAYPFGVGLTVAVGAFATGVPTGTSLNPARGLAPALVSGEWGDIASWLAGPVIGALLAWAVYRYVISPAGSGDGRFGGRRESYPQPVPPPGPSLLP
jgi:MIP family channel proteins